MLNLQLKLGQLGYRISAGSLPCLLCAGPSLCIWGRWSMYPGSMHSLRVARHVPLLHHHHVVGKSPVGKGYTRSPRHAVKVLFKSTRVSSSTFMPKFRQMMAANLHSAFTSRNLNRIEIGPIQLQFSATRVVTRPPFKLQQCSSHETARSGCAPAGRGPSRLQDARSSLSALHSTAPHLIRAPGAPAPAPSLLAPLAAL